VSRFFAVDLILPEHYYQTFLPAVAQRNPGWSFFYEIKANVTRSDVEQLAAAGVRWIQPGIESLDTQVLDLMRKGCKPYQNVQLLKWCGQLGIRVSWNVIIGTPGEDPGLYTAMASLMSRLVHLPPPSGCIELALHRFSPYHMQPQEFGIENLGALGMYRHIFPLPQPLLDDLVYQFEFRVTGRAEPPRQYAAPAIAAAERWKRLHAAGASLRLQRHGDGTASIVDRRDPAGERVTALTADELALYDWLDPAAREETLEAGFERDHPAAWARLAPLAPRIERWDELGLVARTDGRTFALAMEAERPS
jgi:ribosomal peptide maturation radical SAM protein 1